MGRFDTLGLTLISDVAVVLLVDSAELGELSFHNFGSHIRVGVLVVSQPGSTNPTAPGLSNLVLRSFPDLLPSCEPPGLGQ